MRKQFYTKALPSQGVYCVTTIGTDGRVLNRFAETLSDVESLIEDVYGTVNIFVALNTFNGHSRRAVNAAYAKSFFLDIDTGEGKDYLTKADALAALDKFVADSDLPPPVRVDSGNGIHAYWLLDRDVPTVEWLPYAEKFKTFCLDRGLHIDPVVTADAARILRAPETQNLKRTPAVPVVFLDTEFHEYDFDLFKEFLGVVAPTTTDILASIPKGLDEETLKMMKVDNYETTFQSIAEKSLAGEGCNQIKHILVNAATLSEPLWHSGLSIARHCVDWETSIHLMSEDHPGYNHEATLKKANETFGKPHSCETFRTRNPGGCEGCKFKGRITNPLGIGRRLKEAPVVDKIDPEDAVRVEEDPKAVPAFPASLKPYTRGVNGGIYYEREKEDGEDGETETVLLCQHDVFPIKRVYHPVNGEEMIVRLILPNDAPREFELQAKFTQALDKCRDTMSGHGAVPEHASQWPHMMNYMHKWYKYFQNADAAEEMRMQMGWTEDKSAFVIGYNEVRRSGEVHRTAASPLVKNVAKALKPSGLYDVWQRAANTLNGVGFEMHCFGLLCGFGSPLMHLTSTSGVAVSFTSLESGNGKTGAMYAGLSVWGHPKEMSLVDGGATDNAFIGRYLALKNIMFGIDEASNARPEAISTLIHRLSHGKSKTRMQSSVNAEREQEGTASLIAMLTSNQPLYDKLQTIKASPDGEVARLVEFVVKKPAAMQTNPNLGTEVFDVFKYHHGHAGHEFIKYYYLKGEDYVKAKIDAWLVRFKKDFGDSTEYRFYQNLVASTFAGGELANEAGIINVDLERVYGVVVSEMHAIKDGTVKTTNTDYRTLVGDFVNDNQHSFLILNDGRVVAEPKGQMLIGRTEVHTGLRFIAVTPFKKFLAQRQISERECLAILKSQKVYVGTQKKRLASGWSDGRNTPPVHVYVFQTDTDELINEIQQNSGT